MYFQALSNCRLILFITLAALAAERRLLGLLSERSGLLCDGHCMRADPVKLSIIRLVLNIYHAYRLVNVFKERCGMAVFLSCARGIRLKVRRILEPWSLVVE